MRPTAKRHDKTILLVEDDDIVRQFLCDFLKSEGYRVVPAVDGEEGVAVYKDNQKDVDLVLMDVMMPRKDGVTANKEITTLNPDAKILMMSGYTAVNLTSIENLNFIPKPTMPETLILAIEDLLACPA